MVQNELVQAFNDAVSAAGGDPQRKTPALYQAKKRILGAVKDGSLAFRTLPQEIQQELRCHYHGVQWELMDDGSIDCPSCRLEPSM
ncbi:MAG: hypothetical protein HYY05_02845 [Chloroflexi bacterium]|nr:hypothetical protein [Chloroflexota bacterium]